MRDHRAARRALMLANILSGAAPFSCTPVGRRVEVGRGGPDRPRRRPLPRLRGAALPGMDPLPGNAPSDPRKSPESTFWVASPAKNAAGSFSSDLPAVHGMDKESGPLPPGAYRDVEEELSAPCLIAVGIRPPSNADGGQEVWRDGVGNCQKLIDSGFNTFRVNNCCGKIEKGKRRSGNAQGKSPPFIATERIRQRTVRTGTRHQFEADFYRTLRQNTPSSVLRSCHFMVNMEIPSVLSADSEISNADEDSSRVPFGNGWMVREGVSNALLRTRTECLDSVLLEYCEDSPYHLDVVDLLFEMRREGLVHSVSTKNFPPSLLRSALDCGFEIRSNDILGNLMNTDHLQTPGGRGVPYKDGGCSRLVSAPLGGGLLTGRYREFRKWGRVPESGKTEFQVLVDSCCGICPRERFDGAKKWDRHRTVMNALMDISLKYQVSVESVALRWLLQLSDDSICIGTLLGMDFPQERGGHPYNRNRNLRQVFTFSLEEDDMERLCRVSGLASPSVTGVDHQVDFTNEALWL